MIAIFACAGFFGSVWYVITFSSSCAYKAVFVPFWAVSVLGSVLGLSVALWVVLLSVGWVVWSLGLMV